MLYLVHYQWVFAQQIDRPMHVDIVRVVRRVHGLMNGIMEHDTEGIGHVSQKLQSGDANSVRLGIGKQVYLDRVSWQRKTQIALNYGDDIVFRQVQG